MGQRAYDFMGPTSNLASGTMKSLRIDYSIIGIRVRVFPTWEMSIIWN